jgi:hypothetical protein
MRPAHFIKEIERRSRLLEEEKNTRSKSRPRENVFSTGEGFEYVNEERRRVLDPNYSPGRFADKKEDVSISDKPICEGDGKV